MKMPTRWLAAMGVLLVWACGKSDYIAGDGQAGRAAAGSGGTAGAGGSASGASPGGRGTGGAGRVGSGGSGGTAGSPSGAGTSAGTADGSVGGRSAGGGAGMGAISGSGAAAGAMSGAGGMAPVAGSGGSSGAPELGGGAGAGCAATDDPSACLCFSDTDCKNGGRCHDADCASDKPGRCATAPSSGCYDDGDCPAGQTCSGGRLAPCGSTIPDVIGTCESTCTLDDPTTCPTGYGCACDSPNNPNVPPSCICHKQCGSASDCSGMDSLCGCGPGIADGLCVSNCFCFCG